MAVWVIYDYVELTGRNPIRRWLNGLPPADQARIDLRIVTMTAMPKWPEKWVSKYEGVPKLYEFRIKGQNVQYRPLGTYWGEKRYVLLAGAIEKGGKIPKSDIDTAVRRHRNLRDGQGNVRPHQFDGDEALEKDGE